MREFVLNIGRLDDRIMKYKHWDELKASVLGDVAIPVYKRHQNLDEYLDGGLMEIVEPTEKDLARYPSKNPQTIANHLRNAVYVKATASGKAACNVKGLGRMYKVIPRPKPAKDLIVFDAVANTTYMRGKTKVTVKGYTYNYCCIQTMGEVRVCKNESAFKHDYCNLNLLKIIKLDNDKQLSNDEIYRIARNTI
jgi:hypothetical protein